MTRAAFFFLCGTLVGTLFADFTYPERQSVACEPANTAPAARQPRRTLLSMPIPYDATATHSGTPGVVPRTYFYTRSR